MREINVNRIPILFQKIQSYEIEDDRFLQIKIWICHTGKNHNGSYFSKEVITDAIPSLANTPILAFIEENSEGEKDFSDHRQILVKENGEMKLKYLGQPIGIIPETNNAKFEMRLCDDGLEREYLVCDGLVWQNKWDDPIDIFNRDVIKNQSMELHSDYEGDWGEDKLFHFTKFKFYGACALGDSVIPAMQNSTIEAQISSNTIKSFTKSKLKQFTSYLKVDRAISEKGGTGMENTNFTLTLNQLRDKIRAELKKEKKIDSWGYEYNKYWFIDADESKVYAEDPKDDYRLVSFNFSISGDQVIIDFNSKARVKISYVPLDNNNTESNTIFEIASQDRLSYEVTTKEREVERKFEATSAEVNRLREFERVTLEKERKIAESELFEQFSSQLTEEELKPLKESASKTSLEDIEMQLYALVGKKNAKFSSRQKVKESVKFNFPNQNNEPASSSIRSYAYLFEN
ncbi:hypothetical protein QJQ58_15695 [Paenibacillus dendritiformis]|uniref:hypothetical protein n=1 Tax=Paenibacillus dendritiformis TaxID=130049 RepID=UPI00248B3B65|nr:hypothetical protein [Paenibacillus dendritiformis]WGU92055.1 hypothetical protein QJQ58_15695 [Paenibacillus dendritiformis]